ncbi:VapE domain-containing protein [Emticicia sp.]|uniref:VapE domain-containing protein n=1 Tax=Emticicia sp. TaxID=1930953 RepID=UPI003750DC55
MEKTENKAKKGKKNHFDTVFHQVEKYLNDFYELRYNLIKCEIESSPKGKNEYSQVNENSLYVELRKKGVRISKDDLKSILKSEFTPRYNPIQTYFNNLLPYNPDNEPDYINKLGSYVKTDEHEDFISHYKKWLVRSVRCGLDDTYFNKQAFILVHNKQNSGKSTFCRFHCPEALQDYIAEEISTDKDGLILLTKNFLINLDELSTLHKSEINSLKAFFTKLWVNVRLPYDSKNSNIARKANFIGSTNKGQFLQDETGSVRWLCFEIQSIDWNYSKEIKIDNVWRQALYLLRSETFKYDLTVGEIEDNETRNMKFQQLTNEMELVTKYFEKPKSKTDGDIEFMQANDVMVYLQQNSGIKVSREYVGRALLKYGFERVQKYNGKFQVWGYNVVKTNLLNFINLSNILT